MTSQPAVDFRQSPFIVIWEVTRACALACVHCRADAIHRRDPRELTTEDGVDPLCIHEPGAEIETVAAV